MTRFSKRRFEGGAVHAASYVTKYLVKTPDYGWPAWVMELGAKRRVPRYSTSRGFWGREPKPARASGETRKMRRQSYAERKAKCGSECNLFEEIETPNGTTGETNTRMKWRCRLGIHSRVLEKYPSLSKSKRRVTLLIQDMRVCLLAIQMFTGEKASIVSPRQWRRR